MTDNQGSLAQRTGGTIVAIVIAFTVLFILSFVLALIIAFANYYLSSVRWEAAVVIGNIVGGIYSTIAARYACDAIIKHYSTAAVFYTLLIAITVIAVIQINAGLTQQTFFGLCSAVAIAGTSYFIFYKNEA